MNHYLNQIVAYKKKLVKEKVIFYSSLKERFEKNSYTNYGLFKKSIAVPGKLQLIAEIKKASPSKGLIREDFDIINIAGIYARHDVAAISVLTEDKYFLGQPAYVKKVADHFHVPVLAKDFFLHEGQIYEARLNGASAVLLIAAILDIATLKKFISLGKRLDVDCLVEVHSEEELKTALDCGAEIIGINNRNLNTFEVDIGLTDKLLPLIPAKNVIVSESGINTNSQIKHLKALGVNAVLIGEAFMREEDISKKIQTMMVRVNEE